MWDITCDTNEVIHETETGPQIQSTNAYQWAEGGERGKKGVEDEEIQTIMYKINKKQGYSIQQREIWPVFCNTVKQSILHKNIQSLCCITKQIQ